jgi:hypothetical protein
VNRHCYPQLCIGEEIGIDCNMMIRARIDDRNMLTVDLSNDTTIGFPRDIPPRAINQICILNDWIDENSTKNWNTCGNKPDFICKTQEDEDEWQSEA